MINRESIAQHILPSSATMVGVCLTSISLVKLIEEKMGQSQVDEYLALNSIIFLCSGVFSYLALRANKDHSVVRMLEKMADVAFVAGLIIMVIIATLFAYQSI